MTKIERHYSTIGIEDIFLSPNISLQQLPSIYIGKKLPIPLTPEIIGTIKTQPEDFVVREIASDKLELPTTDERSPIAKLTKSIPWETKSVETTNNNARPVQPAAKIDDGNETSQESTICLQEKTKSPLVLIEEEKEPISIILKILLFHHPENAAEHLLSLKTLQESCASKDFAGGGAGGNKNEKTDSFHWIPPLLSDSSCLSEENNMRGGDRGTFHRSLKLTYSFLTSTTVIRDEEGAKGHWIRVSIDSTYFSLSPYISDPVIETLSDLYLFRNRGCVAVKEKDNEPPPRKRQRFNNRNRPRNDDYSFVIKLRDSLSKDDRREVHHLISSRDFETRTLTNECMDSSSNTSSSIAVQWSQYALRKATTKGDRGSYKNQKQPKSYLLLVLKKRQKEHLAAIQTLLRLLGIKRQSDIGIAGIKDMHAVTYQYCTIRDNGRFDKFDKLAHLSRSMNGVEIDSFCRVTHFLERGDLRGNQFVILVRDVKRVRVTVDAKDNLIEETVNCDKTYILARVEALKTQGFINFYGEQRLGIAGETHVVGARSFDIGRAMMQQDFDKALDLLISGRLICRGIDEKENPKVVKVRETWRKTKDVDETYKLLPKGDSMTRERTVLKGFKRYKNSLAALKCLHFQVRSFWINSYQAYIWNQMASERLKLYGTKVVPGDLVRRENGDVGIVNKDDCSSVSFEQVVLPLPGYRVLYPKHSIGERYQQVLMKEKVQFLKDAPVESTAKGSYRNLVVLVNKLEVEFPGSNASAMDTETFQLSFDLPPGSYATMLLRELMVMTRTRN